VASLVLEERTNQAINILKLNTGKNNSNFFEAHLLIILDSLKKNNLDLANELLINIPQFLVEDRLRFIIFDTLKQYVRVFKDKKILKSEQNFGNFTLINETFQRCYLNDEKTSSFFSNLINNSQTDYSRYIYFYLTYLIDENQIDRAKDIAEEINYITATLLISQGKSWIDKNEFKKFNKIFSCKNYNDIIGEFLFLISNIYSAQNEFEKSNFYLNLSIFMNPKFIFNQSLVAENLILNEDYQKAKDILSNFQNDLDFYYWYRIKKEAHIISKTKNQNAGLIFIKTNFKKIKNPNNKIIFDVANFHKKSKKYLEAIKFYSVILNALDVNSDLRSDLLYRRGGCYERLKDFKNSDKDLLDSLKIDPDDAYILNYLAYSWLERDYKIDEAIQMLEKAYARESDDPYIIDSIGWAYYLINDFVKAESFMRRAVELMPDDPVVNDHYGDILWKLDRKIQARYFWSMVLKMENVEDDLLEKIDIKLIKGIKKS
tara:strand:- start:310 stop:1773 length:1464 start_codon:yes stop_codon:yes gene_type:complete